MILDFIIAHRLTACRCFLFLRHFPNDQNAKKVVESEEFRVI